MTTDRDSCKRSQSLVSLAPGLAGILGPILFVIITLIAHLNHGPYDAVRQTISELALGANGWVQVTGFVLLAVLIIIMGAGIRYRIGGTGRINAVSVLLVIIGVGFLFICIFPTDVEGSPLTVQNLIHQATVRIIAVLFPIACFMFAHGLAGKKGWRGIIFYTIATGAIAAVLDVLWLVIPDILEPRLGLYERIASINALLWMEVIGIKLLIDARHLAAKPGRLN